MNTKVTFQSTFWGAALPSSKVIMFSLLFLASILNINSLQAQCTLGCNDNVQVSLDNNCKAEVTVGMISPSAASACVGGNFKVIVMAQNGSPLAGSPFVGINEIGKKLVVKVLDQVSGQSCWGSILVEDKLPPIITSCKNDTFPCTTDWKAAGVVPNPVYTENCSTATVTFTETISDIACGAGDFTAVITRFYTIKDASGNKSTCTKEIYLKRGNMANIVWPKHRDDIQAPALSCVAPNTNPSNTGEPSIGGFPLVMLCDLMASYSDQVKDLNASDKIVIRTWVVIDWCTGVATSFIQNIRILDKVAPTITCPQNITIGTKSTTCNADYTFPNYNVTDNCSPANKIIKFVTVNGDQVNALSATGLAVGTHTIVVKAVDDANNSATCTYTVTVVDNVPPVAVCDEFTKISLGLDGTAEVNAITFDDGSLDNCELDRYEVSRLTTSVSFGPKIKFDCNDINKTINVVLRVWDKSGNYNDCTVEVKIEDKLSPKITCAPDLTLNCRADYKDFSITGKAVATDNCNVTVTNVDLAQVTNCGTGTVKRTWIATDAGGRTAACIQYITLVNNTPFYINASNSNDPNDDITWPADYLASGCGPSLLPAIAGAPILKTDDCDLIAVTYEDTELPTNGGGCLKVLRKWLVVDWCQYKANTIPKVGYWEYTQTITVMNSEPPKLNITCQDVTFNSDDANCATAKIDYLISASDDCTPVNKLKWTTKIDLGCNGNYDRIGITGDLSGTYPVGTHCVYLSVEDGCGNLRTCNYKITIRDAKKPTPVCHHGLSTTLMATGMVTVTPKMFDGGSFDNCTASPDLVLSLAPNTFTCKDLGPNLVTFTVTDKAGNSDFCTTYVDIQDNMNMCPDSVGNKASIAGAIKTSTGSGVENVGMKVDGTMSPIMSSKTGDFLLYKLIGKKYDVAPEKTGDWMNGVSTLDIVKITKHILGNDPISTPYGIIAADVNNSGKVSTADVIALRKVILGVDSKFPNGQQSWRFVKNDFTFIDPKDPFTTPFPEMANIDLTANATSDFTAIKIGDINGSAVTSSANGNASGRNEVGVLILKINDLDVISGQTYRIPVTLDAYKLAGAQFTMLYDENTLELTDIQAGNLTDMNESNFAVVQSGVITTSWNSTRNDARLAEFFTLEFKAKSNGKLSDMITLNSAVTSAEAYTTAEEDLKVDLQFKQNKTNNSTIEQSMTLFQNQPNPFSETTEIRFFLPDNSNAILTVMDVNGRIVRQWKNEYSKGYHTLSMNKNELSNSAAGIFYYQLQTATQTATKKMIIVE